MMHQARATSRRRDGRTIRASGARDILRAACWASDVRVVASTRYAHVVVLEVIRRLPPGPADEGIAGWPFLNRGETDSVDPEEPAWHGGPGHHGPFG